MMLHAVMLTDSLSIADNLVRVAMVMMVAVAVSRRACHIFNGNNAPMRLFAANMLKLDGAVANVVVVFKNVVQLHQDACAF